MFFRHLNKVRFLNVLYLCWFTFGTINQHNLFMNDFYMLPWSYGKLVVNLLFFFSTNLALNLFPIPTKITLKKKLTLI